MLFKISQKMEILRYKSDKTRKEDLCVENYKMLMEKVKEDLKKCRDIPCS